MVLVWNSQPNIWIDIRYTVTHWGRVTHTCVGKLTHIGSDNGLSPGWRQAIIWPNAGILLNGHMETNFSERLIQIQTFSLTKIRLTRPTLERWATLGHLRSIKPNMINTFANLSQTCQLLKNIFFLTLKRKLKKWCNIRLNWYRKSISIIERVISIYLYRYILNSWHHNLTISPCISKFTRWAIIEELSKRRRLRTYLINRGQKTRVKHCYVDFLSWYDFWFAISAPTWKWLIIVYLNTHSTFSVDNV